MGAKLALRAGGLQGWVQSVDGYDGEGYHLGRVYFGGRDDGHGLATSSAADAPRAGVVAHDCEARTSRVDPRVDTLLPMADLEWVARQAANTYGSLVTVMESDVRGESRGRTLYVGAPSSA